MNVALQLSLLIASDIYCTAVVVIYSGSFVFWADIYEPHSSFHRFCVHSYRPGPVHQTSRNRASLCLDILSMRNSFQLQRHKLVFTSNPVSDRQWLEAVKSRSSFESLYSSLALPHSWTRSCLLN